MNAFQRARDSLAGLANVLYPAGQTHNERHQQPEPLPKPRAVQLFIAGNAPIQLRDADTGHVLGFRQTYTEACGYARELERGAA